MTSILDQYEQASQRISHKLKVSSLSELTSQYSSLNIDTDWESNDSLFSICKLKVNPPITTRLQHLSVGGHNLVFVTVNNLFFYLNWKNLSKAKEIDINKAIGFTCKVNKVFVEPVGGHHVLLSVSAINNVNSSPTLSSSASYLFYCNITSTSPKFKQVDKMRTHKVTAVAWNCIAVTSQCTAPILLGTSNGLIFEIKLNVEAEKLFLSNTETYCKEVFDIGKSSDVSAITGIEFCKFSNVPDIYFIIVTTVKRLYQFVGPVANNDERPFSSQIFDDYLKYPEHFIEIPNSNNSYSLVYFTKVTDETGKTLVIPKSFGWHVHGIGIIYRQLQLEWRKGLTEVCIQNRVLDYSPLQPAAITFVLTSFHVLLLHHDRIVCMSVLNKEVVFTETYDESYGKYIDMCKDFDDNVWVLSERAIHKGQFNREDRFVWKIYLDMKKFSLAKEYCQNNLHHLYNVMKKEAKYYFDEGKYEESAYLYSQIDGISFEEISLEFLQVGQIEALKLYLLKMLEKLKSHESTHITMITFWLIEIYEKQMNDAKFNIVSSDERLKLQKDFITLLFLPNVHICVKKNKEAIYKILSSHGDTDNLIKVAKMLKDFEKVVRYYLEEADVNAALNVLKDELVGLIQKNLINSFMPKFISLAPKQTVDVLMKLGRNLEPLSILPSLILPYEDEAAIEVIRYLEYCIHSLHSHDEAIHNYLITLYARYKPEKMKDYLATQGQDKSDVNYSIRYALKLCQEYKLTEACVQLSALLGLWESAVDMALSVNIELAKQTVPQTTVQNGELCKKLWLKIGQHIVKECNNIEKVMEFLQQCDLIKIEDILPFFNDFVTIDHFKDAVCSSLQEYNQNIELLKEEMNDATKSAGEIRSDIQSFRNRCTVIQTSDVCCSCNIQLLIRPFYVFPCSHFFHVDCLIEELKLYLSETNIKRIDVLQQQLSDISSGINGEDTTSLNSNSFSLKEQLKNELDSIIAADCFFCGYMAVEDIDRPFIQDDEFERIRLDWE